MDITQIATGSHKDAAGKLTVTVYDVPADYEYNGQGVSLYSIEMRLVTPTGRVDRDSVVTPQRGGTSYDRSLREGVKAARNGANPATIFSF